MLTAYEITYTDGSKSRTSMAAGVTLEDAQKYFIGQRFDLGVFPVEKMVEAVAVNQIIGNTVIEILAGCDLCGKEVDGEPGQWMICKSCRDKAAARN